MKLNIYISDHESYANGEYNWCFNIYHDPETVGRLDVDYTFFAEVDVEPADVGDVTKKAVAELDKQIQTIRAKAESHASMLETRKQNLLAITHQGAA